MRNLAFGCVAVAFGSTTLRAADDAQQVYFEKHIRPLLIAKCYECHAADTEASGGLLLDSRTGWQHGGDSGASIVPGKPDESRVIRAVLYTDPDLQMPPEGPLSAGEVELLRKWIADGAVDPREASAPLLADSTALPLERAQEHWAYRPLSLSPVPVPGEGLNANNAIDAFIGEQLLAADLPVAPRAARVELLRRMSFDLHGLPPSAESLAEIEGNTDPDAVDRAVDRLLASPRFGERIARHWMDVARYAESVTLRGFVLPQAWRYRDYLIATFREDRSYADFVREQIAGDLLEHPDRSQRQQQLIATTFLALGNTNLEEQDKAQLEMDYVDEQLEVIGRVFMGQTIGCARCHDHKFDPIPTSDYYALAGIFKAAQSLEHANVSKWIEKPLPDDQDKEQNFAKLEEALKQTISEQTRIEKMLGKKVVPKSDKSIAPDSLPGIVVDDSAAMKVGSWKESAAVKPFVGAGYIHDENARDGKKTLTFQPDPTPEGLFNVRLAYTPGKNRATKSLVRVFSADGEASVTVDQQLPPPIDGMWFSLGEFRFEKNGQAFVMLSNEGANGHVVADAVQFLPVDATSVAVASAAPSGSVDKTQAPALSDSEQKLSTELTSLKAERKRLEGEVASRPRYMTINETLPASDIPIHIRGNVHNLGAVAPRGFLRCADFASRSPFPSETSGRREFAEWLSDARHPLTARVFVNRMWLWLYGAALVPSVDNFGTTGEQPTHPELLDHLAKDFIDHDWSPQVAVRRMVLSATYQRTVRAEERAFELDPDNKLFGRSHRKRLDVESLRDAMLAISDELAIPPGGATLKPGVRDDYHYEHAPTLRGVYQPILRNSLPELYEAFDFPNPSFPSGERAHSVVSPQALAMLNSPWIHARVAQTAEVLLHSQRDFAFESQNLHGLDLQGHDPQNNGRGHQSTAEQFDGKGSKAWQPLISHAFVRCIGREPTNIELYTAESLVEELEATKTEPKHIVERLIHGLFASIDFRYLD